MIFEGGGVAGKILWMTLSRSTLKANASGSDGNYSARSFNRGLMRQRSNNKKMQNGIKERYLKAKNGRSLRCKKPRNRRSSRCKN